MRATLTTDEFNALDDSSKSNYTKAPDGSGVDYIVKLDGLPDGWALENVSGLKATVSTVRGERDKARTQLAVYADDEGVFLDPAQARDALAKVGDLANMTPNDKAKAAQEAAVGQVEQKYKGQLTEREQRIQTLTSALEGAVLDAALTGAINEHGGNAKLLAPALRPRLKMHEENGKFRVQVLGEDGNPRLTMKPNSTEEMEVSEFVGMTKNDAQFAPAFNGSGASGTGANANRSGGAGGRGGQHTISAEDARDPARYRAAKEAATKAGATLAVDWDGASGNEAGGGMSS